MGLKNKKESTIREGDKILHVERGNPRFSPRKSAYKAFPVHSFESRSASIFREGMPKITPGTKIAMILRALTLRCPHCGARGVLASWFKLKERCPRCKLHLHRDERDYFLGAYTIMLIAVEMSFAFGFLIVLLITWPNPPWEWIQWGGAVVLTAGVLIAYPFAKTLFLAIDLIFRPVSSSELGWYDDDEIMKKIDEPR